MEYRNGVLEAMVLEKGIPFNENLSISFMCNSTAVVTVPFFRRTVEKKIKMDEEQKYYFHLLGSVSVEDEWNEMRKRLV